MKILIIAPSWIGDTVAAQPLFMRLLERHPGAVLDVLAPPWVAGVLRVMPQIRGEILTNPFGHGQLSLGERWRLARKLRQRRYDMAVVLPNSLKSALMPFLAGIPVRVGFTGESRYGLINRRHQLDETALPLQVERYAVLAEAPGAPLPRPLPQPRLAVSHEAQIATLGRFGLQANPAPVILCPGAEYGPAKRWPAEHFAALARQLDEQGIPVWLLGSQKDAAVAQEIALAAKGRPINLCGRTDLDEAIQLLATARHVVSNDSGLMHVAAALERPLVALFGSSSPAYTPPLSDKAQVIWLKLACSPCFERECPLGHLNCLWGITPEQVLEKTRSTHA